MSTPAATTPPAEATSPAVEPAPEVTQTAPTPTPPAVPSYPAQKPVVQQPTVQLQQPAKAPQVQQTAAPKPPTLEDAIKHLDACQKYYEQGKFQIGHADNVKQVKDPATGKIVQEEMGGYNPHFALFKIKSYRNLIDKAAKMEKPIGQDVIERILRIKQVEPTEQHIRDTEFDLYRTA